MSSSLIDDVTPSDLDKIFSSLGERLAQLKKRKMKNFLTQSEIAGIIVLLLFCIFIFIVAFLCFASLFFALLCLSYILNLLHLCNTLHSIHLNSIELN